jgi:hypothetical protein
VADIVWRENSRTGARGGELDGGSPRALSECVLALLVETKVEERANPRFSLLPKQKGIYPWTRQCL